MPDSMQNSGDGLGADRAAQVIAAVAGRGNGAPATQSAQRSARGFTYRIFRTRHPDYDVAYWRVLRAFYAGGKALLGDRALMRDVFPRHKHEVEQVYRERLRRAFYVPYCGEILDHIIAALTAQPVTMATEGEGESVWPEFYDSFYEDVSPPAGRKQGLNQLLKEQILTALICRRAWTLVELPPQPMDRTYESLSEQERAGGLSAYALPLVPDSVLDWEEDDSGELVWALVGTVVNRRNDLASTRENVTEKFTYYTRDSWERYEISYPKDQKPDDRDAVALVDEGIHSFGRVPLLRLEVPEGLWAMAKLEPLAREHFNKLSALSWAVFQSLFQELYEFYGPEDPSPGMAISEKQNDPSRGTVQVRGQGYIQERGHQDRAEFVGPDTSPFEFALKACNALRDEMHRVTHQMALTVDNSASALRRSGESKAQDKAATAVILTALGKLVRDHAEDIYNLISVGRGDNVVQDRWAAQGMEKFDAVQVTDAIKEALDINDLAMESPTFRIRHRFALAKLILGDDATPDDLDDIERELSENIHAEDTDDATRAALESEDLVDESDLADEQEEEVEGERVETGSSRARRTMFQSSIKGRS